MALALWAGPATAADAEPVADAAAFDAAISMTKDGEGEALVTVEELVPTKGQVLRYRERFEDEPESEAFIFCGIGLVRSEIVADGERSAVELIAINPED